VSLRRNKIDSSAAGKKGKHARKQAIREPSTQEKRESRIVDW